MDKDDATATNDAHPWEQNFRTAVVKLRKAAGMNQTDLARELANRGLPFHQQTVQRMEAGQRPVRLNEAHIIADVLDSSLDAMASSAMPSLQDVVMGVEAMRRTADREHADIFDSFDRLIAQVTTCQLAVDAITAGGIDPETEPVARWAFDWCQIGWNAILSLAEAMSSLQLLEDGEPQGIAYRKTSPEYLAFEELGARLGWLDDSNPIPAMTPPLK